MKLIRFKIKSKLIRCILASAVPVVLVALAGALLTAGRWFDGLIKPGIMPPGWVFSAVWGIAYILVGITVYFACCEGSLSSNKKLRRYYIISGILHIAWVALIRLRWLVPAFVILLAYFIVSMLLYGEFRPERRWVRYLLVPYILWVFYAGVINYSAVMLN
jgi:benzodiazapine receptor